MTTDNNCRMSIQAQSDFRICCSKVPCDYNVKFADKIYCGLVWSYRPYSQQTGVEIQQEVVSAQNHLAGTPRPADTYSQEAETKLVNLRGITQSENSIEFQDKPRLPDTKLGSCRQPTPNTGITIPDVRFPTGETSHSQNGERVLSCITNTFLDTHSDIDIDLPLSEKIRLLNERRKPVM